MAYPTVDVFHKLLFDVFGHHGSSPQDWILSDNDHFCVQDVKDLGFQAALAVAGAK